VCRPAPALQPFAKVAPLLFAITAAQAQSCRRMHPTNGRTKLPLKNGIVISDEYDRVPLGTLGAPSLQVATQPLAIKLKPYIPANAANDT
jgi:hypothetical protein